VERSDYFNLCEAELGPGRDIGPGFGSMGRRILTEIAIESQSTLVKLNPLD
jgi:hypothetical protein